MDEAVRCAASARLGGGLVNELTLKAICFRSVIVFWTMTAVFVIGWSPDRRASAQTSNLGGGSIFSLYCASCHGTSAKGDGPLASSMRTRPADLTEIAKRNRGTFPAEQVLRTIDGRSPVRGHGGGEMPVWGDAFAGSKIDSMPVEQKIQRLVSYLESIQIKP